MIVALIRRVVVFELGLWRSLYRWVFRRPLRLAAGDTVFSYARGPAPVIWAIIVVSAIEIPAVHLLLPWETARLILLIAGIQGLFWMVGFMASLHVHPHVVGSPGLRIRHGTGVDLHIPWEAVATVRSRLRSMPSGRKIQFGPNPVLHVAIMSQTNVDVVLRDPMPAPLPGNDSGTITELRFYADQPGALAERATAALALWSTSDSARRDTSR